MRMLRWMCGVAKLLKISNERIRGNESGRNRKESTGKMMKWYGHVMRRDEHYDGRWKLKYKGEGREEALRGDG